MEYDKQQINRLKRAEGQIKGILRMMEEGKDCRDVVTQLSATRTALDRTIGLIVARNLEECLRNAEKGEDSADYINEAVQLLVKSR
ncbi:MULTISPECIES: metal-sensitive transcriptional regulator [Jeotgalibacillus]|uniref:Metal-sensitive transcriptional regulator n=1 Tax=Jeotgalibacillus haloalkalitolerans TaxID=3104292 RepID=A0ABU5KPL7_9BACL|nr:metal-sensitive transcriptional regulator [Jeotgalibacillus sp. HH7-29]MDZ5713199.1 metal-sensitive transcriptional regulator [Jeotgalibacillus sp. HH7-29]